MNSRNKAVVLKLQAEIEQMLNQTPDDFSHEANTRSTPCARSRKSKAANKDDSADIHYSDELARAKKKLEGLCIRREQSSVSMLQRLAKDGFSEQTAQEAVSWAVSIGLISDERFADVLVRSRLLAGKGRNGILKELERHAISFDSLDNVLEALEVDEDNEIQRALQLLERKPPRSKNKRDGAYRKLVQQGYAPGISARAARIWSESLAE